jgi:hypothetical protein
MVLSGIWNGTSAPLHKIRRAFPGHSPTRPSPFLELARTHLLPSLSCALSQMPSLLSLALHAPVQLRRGPSSIPWPPTSFCHVCCFGELRLLNSNARHPLVCPKPLCFARSALISLFTVQPELCRRRPKASLCPRRCSSALV